MRSRLHSPTASPSESASVRRSGENEGSDGESAVRAGPSWLSSRSVEAASRALLPLRVDSTEGGVRATLAGASAARYFLVTTTGERIVSDLRRDVFAHLIGDIKGSRREEMIDMLVVATDVYTWKLLRRDRGLSRDVVEKRMTRLAEAVAGGERHG